ncbi:MAG: tetratricopeptide repeat protein [Nostocaceae cyanobacterium]|nr:tetratricopeptide repeat protein [Nostocaceae cyanobacterium]
MSHKRKGKTIRLPCRGIGLKGKRITNLCLFTVSFFLFTYPVELPALGSKIATAQAQNLPAGVKKGFDLLEKGLVNDAITAFQQALKRQPRSLQARLGLAISYRRAGRIEEAWNAYQRVLEIDPNNQLALKSVGLLGTFTSNPQRHLKGIEALTKFLQQNPDDMEARGWRATLYSYRGRFGESLADYEIVLANNPSLDAIIGAAQTYTYTGNFEKALELFNRYRSSGRNIESYAAVAYGTTLRETGNVAAAIQVLEAQLGRSTSLDEVAIFTRKELSAAYLKNGQEAQALAILDPLQGRTDAILPLARGLNEIRNVTDNRDLANQVFQLYSQALSQNPNPSVNLLKEAGDVFSGLGLPQGEQRALQLYRQAVAQSPNDQSLLVRQFALENKLGFLNSQELTQRLLATLQTLPSNPSELQEVGKALAQVENPDPQLLTIYQTLLHSTVNNTGVNLPFLYFRLAQIYVGLNDTNNARQALAAYTSTPQGQQDLAPQLLAADIERLEGNLEGSAQRYQALIANQTTSSNILDAALQGLAGIRLIQQRYQEALAAYDQLIARKPQDINLQLGRTSIAYQAKVISQAQAEAVLNSWLATQPATNTPPELFSLVEALPANPQREGLYSYLAQVNPSRTRMQVKLIEAIKESNPVRARALARALIVRLPNTPNNYQLQAELSRAAGNFNRASEIYKQILAQQPDNVDALAALGGVRFEQRRFMSAQQIYEEVVALKPGDKDAQRALAELNAVLDKPLAALEQLEQMQMQQASRGTRDIGVSQRMQQIQEGFLRRRGFQPPWERF